MTPMEQQRLIGAILLLLIISAVSYFLISGTNTHVTVDESETVQSEQSFTSVIEPISEDDIEVVDYADETLLDPQNLAQTENVSEETSEVVPSVEPVVTIDDAPTPTPKEAETNAKVWLVQLGSFSVKSNADALVKQLTKLGYKPSVKESVNDKGTIYRVRLASIQDKNTAEKLAEQIKQKLKLSPQVIQQKR